jgi:hypothetical protein
MRKKIVYRGADQMETRYKSEIIRENLAQQYRIGIAQH